MEKLIEARVILGILCFFHILLMYAGTSGAVHNLINKKVLNGLILAELVAVTAFVVYDNLQTPPYNGWFWAIVGYLFVYGLILLTWVVYGYYTLLKKDKVYEMTIKDYVHLEDKIYFRGTVFEGEQKIEVWLPYEKDLPGMYLRYPGVWVPFEAEYYLAHPGVSQQINVKFNIIMYGKYIMSAV